jgi:hypothetical protein
MQRDAGFLSYSHAADRRILTYRIGEPPVYPNSDKSAAISSRISGSSIVGGT